MGTQLEFLLSSAIAHGDAIARVVVILVMTIMFYQLTRRLLPRVRDYIASQQSNNESTRRIDTLSRVLRYSINVAIVIVTIVLILSEFGISIAPILGAAGVVGLAIGFGAQSLVKDYFTGFFLLLENQIRHGDVVEAGGKAGLVEELTLRYLKLRDYNGNVHYIPNGMISIVTNMSLGYAYAVIDASVTYGTSIDSAIEALCSVGNEMQKDLALRGKILDNLEIAGVENLAESSIVIRCRFKVAALAQWDVRREFLKRLKLEFERRHIEIPYPHWTIVTNAKNTAAI